MDSRNVCSNNCNCDCNTDYLPPCPPCGDIPLPPPRPCPPVPGCGPNPPGCSNHTPNYGLPLWKASDVTSWLMQMNGAMLRIDTILHDLALRTGINGLPDDLVTTVSNLCQNYEVLKCTVSEMGNKQANLELLMQNLNTQVSSMKTDVSAMSISITNFDTRLLSQESVTGAIRNDINLIKADMNMLNKTLTNLASSFTQFQQTASQQLAEHSAAIQALQNNATSLNDVLIVAKADTYEYFEHGRGENGLTITGEPKFDVQFRDFGPVMFGMLRFDEITVVRQTGANANIAFAFNTKMPTSQNINLNDYPLGTKENVTTVCVKQGNTKQAHSCRVTLAPSSTGHLGHIFLSIVDTAPLGSGNWNIEPMQLYFILFRRES